jgi:D-glycerate 3-kinase
MTGKSGVDPAWLERFIRDERLPAGFAAEIDALHAPLAARIAAVAMGPAFVVGICGPQGSGKTTTVRVLAALLEAQGLKVAILSLDDLYLTRADRQALAREVHPLLRTRGVPGTHDIGLGLAVLDGLAGEGATLPRFDKATDDRAPETAWPVVEGPVDIVLLEGWCVGARPEPDEALGEPVNALERDHDPHGVWRSYVNAALAGPYRALFARLDLLVLFTAPDFDTVLAWRQEQEAKLRHRLAAVGGQGAGRAMDPAEVAAFVQHYERLTGHVAREMPGRADLVVRLDSDRRSSIA